METGVKLSGVTDWMEAEVPGSVHTELLKAQLIEDPYYELNSLKCEWVSNRWWIYKTTFNIEKTNPFKKYRIVFKGIDYQADILLNGVTIGQHEGMYIPFKKDITEYIRTESENEIMVIIKNAPDEMGQIGLTSQTSTQKSRFNYKWDFSTRVVNLGLYDDVYIEEYNCATIDASYIRPVKLTEDQWKLSIDLDCITDKDCNLALDFKLTDNCTYSNSAKQEYSLVKGNNVLHYDIFVENPKLWWPNGYGDPSLYNLTVEILYDNTIESMHTYQVGFRTLCYQQAKDCRSDALPYQLVINDRLIYMKGVNMVPLDHLYGSVKEEEYHWMLNAAKDAHVNLVRVWGGGLIEKDIFYSICDQMGIMIWQEFIQSSSGCDNIPSKRPEFLALLKQASINAVKTKRNFVSLTFWSGGNELADGTVTVKDHNYKPADFNDENLQMLKGIVDEYDFDTMMLPTSASGDIEYLDPARKGANHDVHGPWKYFGVEKHYELYNASDSILHSEFGCEGMSEIGTLKKIFSEKNLKVNNMIDNLSWRHHGEWWDTYEIREKEIFGEFQEDALEDFIKCSQFLQAEAIRYAVESNRRREWQNCGSIIWQLNEPWPNVCCSNLIDYYKNKKLAYYYMEVAFRGISPTLKYNKLVFENSEIFDSEIYLVNDFESGEFEVRYSILDTFDNELFSNTINFVADTNATGKVCSINWAIPMNLKSGFKITISAERNEKAYKNEYIFLVKNNEGKADRNFVIDYYEKEMKAFITNYN
jgi:beta-mannosidase